MQLPYEYNDNTLVSVTFEMNLNVLHYERKIYTIFDMLSDWGGFNGIVLTVLSLVSAAWNHLAFDNFMVSRLFKFKKPDEEIIGVAEYFNQSEYFKLSRFPLFKECLLSCIPSSCNSCQISKCCKRTRKE